MAGPVEEGPFGPVQLGRLAWYARDRRRVITVLVVVASVLTCVGLAAVAGWRPMSRRIDRLAWQFLPVILGAHLLAYAGYMVAHHEVFNRSGARRLGWRLSSQVALIGFGGWLVGGGFDVDRRAHITAGFSTADAGAAVIALGALELAVLTPAAWICALLINDSRGLSGSVTWPWVVGVPLGFVVVLMLLVVRWLRGERRPPRRLVRVRGVADGLEATLALLRDTRRGPAALAGIAGYWAADVFALDAALRFAAVEVTPGRLVVAYATAYFLTRRTLPFAGVVVLEALLAVSLVWVGIPLAAAVLAVLTYRLSDFALTLGGALSVSYALEGRIEFLPPARRTQ